MAAPRQDQDPSVPPKSRLLSKYSDASSSYWPPGWNFERFAYGTSDDLPDDERAKMQAGLRDVLGEDGLNEMARVLWQEQQRLEKLQQAASEELPRAPSPPTPPEWLTTWKKRYKGQPWGFVAFREANAILPAGSTVDELQDKIQRIVELPFDAALEQGQPADQVAEARSAFEVRWVEIGNDEATKEQKAVHSDDRSDDQVLLERLRAQYRSMKESEDLPPGLSMPVFLYASPAATTSVLTMPPSAQPETNSPGWRADAPFLLVVAAEEDTSVVDEMDEPEESDERKWSKRVFRAAAEVLVEELWWVLAEQITTLGRLARFVREAKLLDGALEDISEAQAVEYPEHDDDGLDNIWWSVHIPPHRMRKRRRIIRQE
ncbi:hypothetical protein HJFPF1_05813 [Paramyrothecium foliicola]|nr:hypothetical protein HJFPF1_05813 [Paramyrothecium foliicola]